MADDFDLDDDGVSDSWDDDGLDDAFGFEDFDMDPGKDRKPIDRVKQAALDELKNKESLLKAASTASYQALPKDYKGAFDDVSDIVDGGIRIYDKAVKDLEPTFSGLKAVGRKALLKTDKILPPGIQKRLENLTAERESGSGGAVDANELAISNSLKDIFDAQLTMGAMDKERADADKEIDRTIAKKTFAAQMDVSARMADGISRLVGYQDNVLSRYQRKSLELQHRHYFASRDLLHFTKASNQDMINQLKVIAKNSALPNEQKVLLSEAFGAQNRQRLIGEMQSAVGDRLKDLPRQLVSNLQDKLGNAISTTNDMFSQLSQLGEMDMEEMGVDPVEMITSQLVAGGMDKGAAALGAKLAVKLGQNEKVRDAGQRLAFFSENKNRLLANVLERAKNTNEFGKKGDILRFIGELASMPGGDGETINNALSKNAMDPAVYDIMTRRSIIEVIPGFLSRILQQVTEINTGEPAERVVFSAAAEAFVSKSSAKKAAMRKLEAEFGSVNRSVDGKEEVGSLGRDARELLHLMDPSGVVLSPTARVDFLLQLTKDSNDGKLFDPTYYAEPSNINSPEAEQIAALVQRAFGIEDTVDGKRRVGLDKSSLLNKSSAVFNKLSETLGTGFDPTIKRLEASGERELLRDLNIITHDESTGADKVNFDLKSEMIRSRIMGALNGDGSDLKHAGNFATGGVIPKLKGIADKGDKLIARVNPSEMLLNEEQQARLLALADGISTNATDVKNVVGERVKLLEGQLSDIAERVRDSDVDVKGFTERTMERVKQIDTSGLKKRTLSAKENAGDSLLALKDKLADISLKDLETLRGKIPEADFQQLLALRTDITGSATQRYHDLVSKVSKVELPNVDVRSRVEKAKSTAKGLVGDIYVKGQSKKPIIRQALLDAGEYIDVQSGKVIKDIHDIRGEVTDRSGNLILSANEYRAGLVANITDSAATGKARLTEVLKNVDYSKIEQLKGSVNKVNIEELRSGVRNAKGQLQSMANDVYVAGNDKLPVLRKSLMEAGEYIDVQSGKVVNRLEDITGQVIDSKGNVVIAGEQYARGLLSNVSSLATKGKGRVQGVLKNIDVDKLRAQAQESANAAMGALSNVTSSVATAAGDIQMPQRSSGGYGGDLEAILNGHTDLFMDNNDYLDKILSRLEDGIPTLVVGSADEAAADKSSLSRRILGGLGKGFGGFAKFTKTNAKFQFGLMGKGLGMGAGLLGKVGAVAKGAVGGSKRNKATDIYVTGESEPRLLRARMTMGHYTDVNTGKPIKSLKDITGPVKDQQGLVVLSLDDFGKGLQAPDLQEDAGPKKGSKALKLMSVLGGIYKKQFNVMGAIAMAPFTVAKKIGSFRSRPIDVYVGDDTVPRLRAIIFRNGGYYSKKTGAVLKNHLEIDGAVVDSDGNEVLSMEDIASKGIFDRTGKPIQNTSFLGGVANKVKGVLAFGGKLAKGTLKMQLAIFKGMGSIFSSIFKGGKEGSIIGGKSEMLLQDIYDHLVDVFPKKSKKFGDVDGDGIREGSVLDQRRKAKAKAAAAAAKAKGIATPGKAGGLAGLLAAGQANGGEDTGTSAEDIAAGVVGGSLATKLLSGAGNLLKGGSKWAVRAAMALPALVSGGGLAAAGSAVMATGAAVGGAVMSFLSAPVVLPALAAAATAYGGYKAFKFFSRRTALEPIEKYRFMQYGVPVNNKHAVVAIRYFEDEMDGEIAVDAKGNRTLDMEMPEIWSKFASDFGADPEDESQAKSFRIWFERRFLPIFALHKLAAANMDGVDVLDVDDELDAEQKATYIAKVTPPNSAQLYAVQSSPWPDIGLEFDPDALKALGDSITAASNRGEDADLDNLDGTKTSMLDKLKNAAKFVSPAAFIASKIHDKVTGGKPKNVGRVAPGSKLPPGMPMGARDVGEPGKLIKPVFGAVSSPFGDRTHPIKGGKKMHKGIDIAAGLGAEVRAAANGTIQKIYYSNSYGNVIYLLHDDGRSTRYAHLDRFAFGLKQGDYVYQGDVIGYVGNTGNSTGPHLHFEYRDNDGVGNDASVLNPVAFFEGYDKESALADIGLGKGSTKEESLGNPITKPNTPVNASAKSAERAIATVADAKKQSESVSVMAVAGFADGSSVPAPTINVAAPNIDGINSTNIELASAAIEQRNMSLTAQHDTNQKLGLLVDIIAKQNNVSEADMKKQERAIARENRGGSKEVKLPVDISKRTA